MKSYGQEEDDGTESEAFEEEEDEDEEEEEEEEWISESVLLDSCLLGWLDSLGGSGLRFVEAAPSV